MTDTALNRDSQIVIETLRANGFLDVAAELESRIAQAKEPEAREKALREIVSMCHPKWLGDLNIKNYEWPHWLRELNNLRKAAERAQRNGL